VPALPTAERTTPIDAHRVALGGSAASIARVARRERLTVAVVSRVGADFPPPFLRLLRAEGVDVTGVERVPGTTTSACIIAHDRAGRQTTLIDQGPMGRAAGARLPRTLVERAGWVHLTTGDPPFVLRLAETARSAGVPIAVDPAQEIHYRWERRPFAALVAHAEILFGNEAEIRAAARLLGVGSPARLVDRVPLVVETRGRRGAVARSRAGATARPAAPAGRVEDPTGAGDAFRGGFYGAFLRGAPIGPCLDAGALAAARWLRERPKTGPGPP